MIRESWAWLEDLRAPRAAGGSADISISSPPPSRQRCLALRDIVHAAPNAQFRMQGLKVAREPHRYSGRTAMRANLSVHEPRQPQDADTALAFSMEGHNGTQAGTRPGALIPYAWAPGWNSPQSWNKFQDEVGGHLRGGDPGVRLIEPGAGSDARRAMSIAIPAAFVARAGEWQALPLAHIFGSEELSARAAPRGDAHPGRLRGAPPRGCRRPRGAENSTLEVSLERRDRVPALEAQIRSAARHGRHCRSVFRDRRGSPPARPSSSPEDRARDRVGTSIDCRAHRWSEGIGVAGRAGHSRRHADLGRTSPARRCGRTATVPTASGRSACCK